MNHLRRSQFAGVVGALSLFVASAGLAQDQTSNSSNSSGAIGPPQLKDFQLEPRERIVTQPQPVPLPPAQVEPRSPTPSEPGQPAQQPTRQVNAPTAREKAERPTSPLPSSDRPEPAPLSIEPDSPPTAAPTDSLPVPVEAPAAPPEAGPAAPEGDSGSDWWPYALLLIVLAGGLFYWSRRPKAKSDPSIETSAESEADPEPASRQPLPRPWIDLDLKAERASFTESEWVVQFQLELSNKGESPASSIRIDISLFNAGKEQDKEIGAFFRTAGRDSTKLQLPTIQPGETGIINGEVAMPLAEMRGMKLEDRTLFIPVMAVNALYGWAEDRKGQTARSYVIGRELQQPGEKMGAFRVDLGPRIWRAVGQRPHKLARRF